MVLPIDWCSKAELLHITTEQGRQFTLVGFRLPAGTPIFSPVRGEFAQPAFRTAQGPYCGTGGGITKSAPDPVNFAFRGDLVFPTKLNIKAEEGTTIGAIGDAGVLALSDYNLVLSIERPDLALQRFVTALDVVQHLFPAAFTRPAREVPFPATNPACP